MPQIQKLILHVYDTVLLQKIKNNQVPYEKSTVDPFEYFVPLNSYFRDFRKSMDRLF